MNAIFNSKIFIILFFFLICPPFSVHLEAPSSKSITLEQKKPPVKTFDEPLEFNELEQITIDPTEEITFGQSAAFYGHFKIYGECIQHAIWARFKRANEEHEIPGKRLRLVSVNDDHRPEQAEKNIKTMLEKHTIDLFFGVMNTYSILHLLPLIEQKKIAMLFPLSDDKKLQNPLLTHLINGANDTQSQIETLIRYCVETLDLNEIAFFHADTDESKKNLSHAINALEKYNLKPAAIAEYNKMTMHIKDSAQKLFATDPQVILCLSTSLSAARLISNFFENGYFGTLFLGTDSTFFVPQMLKLKGAQFYYTSFMPDPTDDKIEIVKQYQKDLQTFYPNDTFNILSLAYYIYASIIIHALKTIKSPFSKKNLLTAIEDMQNIDLYGFTILFDPNTRNAYTPTISLIKG